MTLILYTRHDCHLCERALEVIAEAGLDAASRDIDADLELLRRYRERVPVLQRPDTGEELGWPFDVARLREFAAAGAGQRR